MNGWNYEKLLIQLKYRAGINGLSISYHRMMTNVFFFMLLKNTRHTGY